MAEYDYIIAGGGTSGCVVAGRLAEDKNVRVLVVEAGNHNQDLETVHSVGQYFKNFFGEQSWNIKSAPMKHANDRSVALHRGKFLGGSSGTNTTFCIRGTKQDYDDWNLPGWSGEEFFAAMRKAETFHPKDWFEHDPEAHGKEGPVHIEPHDIAPISKLMLKSYQSYGLPYHPDMFSSGKYSHGCGHAMRTHHKKIRSTGADYVTKGRASENLEIKTNTLVDKVNLEKDGDGWRAASLELIDTDGNRTQVSARRDIIISSGAYCSAAILMRSGVGRKEDLEKVGIESKLDSRGVGQNLIDHVICFVPYEVGPPRLTLDHISWHGDARDKAEAQWKENRTGFFEIMPFGVFAYARLDDRLKDSALWQEALKSAAPGRDPMGLAPHQPNMETFHTESAIPDMGLKGEESIIALIVELFNMRSQGTVTIKSADPQEKPICDHNFFDDPLDLEVMSEACNFANEMLMNGEGTNGIIKGAWPPDAKYHTFKNREEWKPWIKDNCQTCYHPTGTCKMGKDGDPMAVLDARARVRGVKGLRVADCSVAPGIPQGHTQMMAYGIGERVADFIKEDWKAAA